MTNALDQFITEHNTPKAAPQPGVYPCIDWVQTDGDWKPCGGVKTQMWGSCPNEHNHGRPVLKAKTQDEIEPGDRIQFYHPSSNLDQWATVLEWNVGMRFPDGRPATWDAVLHIEHLGLGNGFGGRARVQRHSFRRYESSGVKYACTPDVFQ
jgi:hypothetical protein